ncbi:hypothetical protein CEXT_644271 [Caerostris extrusa]|uniref:Uncharacterized protein n=1 Tax=Caerostris extrusa TaxID=172846 RepID=A0AAV4UPP7_CAEEX|nr:hypothetical protein CEXT_644271 [Caerostris extrusa]
MVKSPATWNLALRRGREIPSASLLRHLINGLPTRSFAHNLLAASCFSDLINRSVRFCGRRLRSANHITLANPALLEDISAGIAKYPEKSVCPTQQHGYPRTMSSTAGLLFGFVYGIRLDFKDF